MKTSSLPPQNLVEFWNVATRPTPANGLGLTIMQTETEMRGLKRLFPLLPDTPDIHGEWEKIVVSTSVVGKQVHDARLVAVMEAHGLTHLLTFNDTDFKRYSGIEVVNPKDV